MSNDSAVLPTSVGTPTPLAPDANGAAPTPASVAGNSSAPPVAAPQATAAPATSPQGSKSASPRRVPVVIPSTRREPKPTNWKNLGMTVGISGGLHGVMLLICAFWYFSPPTILEDIFTVVAETKEELPEEPIIEKSMLEADTKIDQSTPDTPVQTNVTEIAAINTGPITLNINDAPPAVVGVEGGLPGLGDIKFANEASGRMSAAAKSAMVRHYGGNSSSEASVASGMKWLAKHQFKDGSWSYDHSQHPDCNGQCSQGGKTGEKSFDCRTGATGLALLAFLGGGHTPESGDFQKEVKAGVEYLIKNGKVTPQGFDMCPTVVANEKMYVQGLCTIALSELAALTKDRRAREAATGAVLFIVNAQNPKTGGWRYVPYAANQGDPGDTSVVAWQIMALKSAQNAKLKFPPTTFKGAELFLNSVQADGGSKYGYAPVTGETKLAPTPTLTAAALLCRMYLGWDRNNKALQEGIEFIAKTKPAANNMYYNYYATQVMHHWGGEEWTTWNAGMRDHLVRTQHQLAKGHLAGSWDVADGHGGIGGRHYMTCLCVMTLEVYYRHLPIYRREGLKVEF